MADWRAWVMIQAGFEFEFGHNIEVEELKSIIKTNFPDYKIFTVNPNAGTYRKLYSKYFNFKWDGSVDVRRCTYNQRELSTPVFVGEKEILANFKKIFDILKSVDARTNRSCSVHINVSFTEDEETQKINLGKLYTFVNELEHLKIFKRTSSQYCVPCMTKLQCKKLIQRAVNDKDLIEKITELMKSNNDDHHAAIAIDKKKNNKLYIIEFRFIGGDYINMFDSANNVLTKVIKGMYYSISKSTKFDSEKVMKKFKAYYGN